MSERQRLEDSLAGRFIIEREIARGGMATVYLATELHPHRTVALKVFDPAVSAKVGEDRFRREIELAAKLTHPGIVAILSAGEADGLLYYTMPYLTGETLRERLDREGQLSLTDALRIVRDVVSALEYAHRRNIVHRDVKPQNILLHEGHAFVADFGVARVLYEQAGQGLTEEGHTVGTPDYMSPEQILGHADIDARSDQYSLACVVYEMLAGEPPFFARTVQSTLSRQLSDVAAPIRIVRSAISEEVDHAVARALAKRPNDRFASVGDFASTLIHTLQPAASVTFGTPTPGARPAIGTAELAVPRRSHRLAWAGAGAALALMFLAVLGYMWSRDPAVPMEGTEIRLAVRAVDNLTGVADNDYIVDLLLADLIDQFQGHRQISVRDRSSSIALRGARLMTPQFADSLEVGFVIESDLRLSGDSVEFHANLVDSTGRVLRRAVAAAGRSFLRNAVVRDSIVHAIAGELQLSLPITIALASSHHHEHRLGREQLVSGMKSLSQRTPAALREAIVAFNAAIGLDGDYAEAYAELAKAYGLALNYRYRLAESPFEAAGLSLAAAERALQIEPTLAGAYAARAYVQRLSMHAVDVVVASFDTAKSYDPNAADAVGWSALAFSLQGKGDAAIAQAQRAINIDKLSASRRITMSVVSMAARRYDDAVQSAAAARLLAPQLALAKAWWARSLVLSGRSAECADADLGPHAGLRALCLLGSGRGTDAMRIVDSLSRLYDAGTLGDTVFTEVIRLEDLATYYAYAGDVKMAVLWTARAFERAPNGIMPDLLESELFNRVRRNREFQEVLDRAHRSVTERVKQSKDAGSRRLGPLRSVPL